MLPSWPATELKECRHEEELEFKKHTQCGVAEKAREETRSSPQKLPLEECPPSKPQMLQGALDVVAVLSGTLAGRGRFPGK